MSVQQAGVVPFQIYGHEVMGFTKAKDLSKLVSGYLDMTSLQEYYEKDPIKSHLGMQASWRQQHNTYKPIYTELLEKKDIIEVDGFEGSFTYDVPLYVESKVETTGDTSDQPYAGVDDTEFAIILSEIFTKGDVLTADPWFNEHQIYISSDEEPKQTGTGYLHYAKTSTFSKEKAYPSWLLKPGVQYTKINHVGSEYTTAFSKVNLPSKGHDILTARFQLGGFRGVEGYVTAFADKKSVLRVGSNDIQDQLEAYASKYDGADAVMFSEYSGDRLRPFTKQNLRAGTLMEYLVHKELDLLTCKSLIWQKGGIVRNENRNVILNEGLIHQARRGYRQTYHRPGGITMSNLASLAAYVYQHNPNLPVEHRVMKLKAGKGAYDNITMLLNDVAMKQLVRLSGVLGQDRVLPQSPVSGALDALDLAPVMFKGVFAPGIGTLSVEHDPNMDYEPLTDGQLTGAHQNGLSRSSYTVMIWDVLDQEYSNNEMGLKRELRTGEFMKGANKNSNIFLVKPEGVVTYWGESHGRWDRGKQMIQNSSSKFLGQEFYAYNSSAIVMLDPSRVAMLELSPRAQLGGGFFNGI